MLRLLRFDWTTADDAIDTVCGNVTVTGKGGGAAQDVRSNVDMISAAHATETVPVKIHYEATDRREIGIWLHDRVDAYCTIDHVVIQFDKAQGGLLKLAHYCLPVVLVIFVDLI